MGQGFWATTTVGLIFISLSAHADVPFAKAQAFLKKNDNCYFAVGLSNPNGPKSASPDVAEDVLCVTDGSIGAGTINEKSGCLLMLLNMNTGKLRKGTFSAMMNPQTVDPAIVKGVNCGKGGFVKLLETKFQSFYGEGPKVKKVLFNGPQGLGARTSVLFSANESARKSYDQAVATLAQEVKLADAKAEEQKRIDQEKAESQMRERDEKEKKRLSSFEGAWVQPCQSDSGVNVVRERAHDNGHYTITISYFDKKDTGCQNHAPFVLKIKGKYTLGKEVLPSNPSKALDAIPEKITAVANTEEMANNLTAKGEGGIIAWEISKEYDLTKSKLSPATFTIYKIQDGALYISEDERHTDAKNRSLLEYGKDSKWIRK